MVAGRAKGYTLRELRERRCAREAEGNGGGREGKAGGGCGGGGVPVICGPKSFTISCNTVFTVFTAIASLVAFEPQRWRNASISPTTARRSRRGSNDERALVSFS